MRTIHLLSAALGLLLMASGARSAETPLYLDTDTIWSDKTMGFGFQWDPSDVWDYTDAQWQRVVERVDFIRPQFVRVCTSAGHYCRGFDAQGQRIYQWDSAPAKRLLRILDYCQQRGVAVMLGEWGAPFGMSWDDPRWSRVIGDCVEYLVRQRGYRCIRYYNKINEPRGDDARYQLWKAAQQSLHDEFARRNLLGQVMLVGPDHSEGAAALGWVDQMLRDGHELFGAYETHWYANSQREIVTGVVEQTLRTARAMVDQRDPAGRSKPFYLGEGGSAEWVGPGIDSNRYIRDYVYGVWMADLAAQTMRAGLDGVSAWMLDDLMHQQPGSWPKGNVPGGDPKVDYNFKVWGLWNSLGSAMGRPEDEAVRPWFYTWSLVCRLFPRGARTIACTNPHQPGARLAAALIARPGGGQDLSLLLVNDSTEPREFRLIAPNALSATTLTEYRYFEGQRPADAKGFPVAVGTQAGAKLADGLTVSLPSQGVVFLTTLGQPQGVSLGQGKVCPVTHIALADPSQTVPVGGELNLTAETDPLGRPVRWSVTDLAGQPTTLATIDADGVLRAKGLGRVRAVATAGTLTARQELELTQQRVLNDPLDDWHLTSSHSSGLVFDTLNTQLFDGDLSRVKRNIDAPQQVVYHLADLTGFSARIYWEGELADKMTVAISRDGREWTGIEPARTPTEHSGGNFRASTLSADKLPAGTAYLRFTLANDTVVWSPQLAAVTLYAAR